jgi:hypothetical protein
MTSGAVFYGHAWRSAALVAVACALAQAAFAQASNLPRTSDGRPDMHGNWSSQWLTPVERPASTGKLVLDAAEAEKLKSEILARAEANNPLDPELAWPDATSLAVVRGQARSSLIISPEDGKLPYNETGRAAARKYIGGLDGPEQRMTTERCIGGVGWAPLQIRSASMIHRIIQTPSHVVMQTEAYDDTRILPIDGKARPSAMKPVGGDSVARWDGDALEVVTRNPDPETSTHGIVTVKSPAAVIVERFELASPDELVYRYTVTDPAYYSQPWTAEYSFVRTTEELYEFACHEGNYSMVGMLSGARREQAQK